MKKILLIIPCYNEEERLIEASFFKPEYSGIDLLFADDGSIDNTAKVIDSWSQKHSSTFTYISPRNVGKAEVIRNAYWDFKEKNNTSEYTLIGFWDADLATPLYEVSNMINFAETFYDQYDSIWGSRIYREGSTIERSQIRHYFGRIFVTISSNLLGLDTYDSQCGAKLFKKESFEIGFKDNFISRWVFDVEVYLRIKGKKIVEYPLKEWRDIPGGKLKVSREIIRVLKDLYNIWRHYSTT